MSIIANNTIQVTWQGYVQYSTELGSLTPKLRRQKSMVLVKIGVSDETDRGIGDSRAHLRTITEPVKQHKG